MCIGVVITEPNEAAALLNWADVFARARETEEGNGDSGRGGGGGGGGGGAKALAQGVVELANGVSNLANGNGGEDGGDEGEAEGEAGVVVFIVELDDSKDPTAGVLEEIALEASENSTSSDATLVATRAAVASLMVDEARDADETSPPLRIVIRRLTGCPLNWATSTVLDQIKALSVSLLITPKHEKTDQGGDALALALFRQAPCDVVVMRPAPQSIEDAETTTTENTNGAANEKTAAPARKRKTSGGGGILVPTSGGPHATRALKLAVDVVGDQGVGYVDALFIEPPVGDDAERVGKHLLETYIHQAGVSDARCVRRRVVLAQDAQAGIAKAARAGYDLILVGASNEWFMRKVLFATVPPELKAPPELKNPKTAEEDSDEPGIALAVMRRAMPMSTRFSMSARRRLEYIVPQLDRDQRVSLVAKVQSNSQFDFDFVALISLSTAIAALGLVRNSSAVVIGAMLVAPLMTPLIGAGLALVQGNGILIRKAARAVMLGFILAFVIGLVIGRFTPGFAITSEMISRGSPNVLDLAVAFLSGLAAAYATARPSLSAALPGVAIAAALVPPIATSGMALAAGDGPLAAGAALLFFTNIVAIVLGAGASLWAVGNRSQHSHSGRVSGWVRPVTLALVIACTALGVGLSYTLYQNMPNDQTPHSASPALIAQLNLQLQNYPNTQILKTDVQIESNPASPLDIQTAHLTLHIASPAPLPASVIDGLAKTAAAVLDQPVEIQITTELITRQSASPPAPSIGPASFLQ